MKIFKNEDGRKEILGSYDRLLGLWGVRTEEHDIEGSYGTTHVITAGSPDSPPLLLFHGVGDNSAMMWIHNAVGLSGNFRMYAIDTMGGPGKSVPGNNYGKGFRQSVWISELMDSLSLEKAPAAGVSYGCYLVQHLLAELPDRIERGVGMAGSIAAKGNGSRFLRMIKAFFPEALFPTDKNIMKLAEKLTGEFGSNITGNEELMNHWRLLLRNFNNMAMGCHRLSNLNERQLAHVRERLLLLIGDRDILSYGKKSLDMLGKTGIDHEILKGCGHSINHEKPDEINERIIGYLG